MNVYQTFEHLKIENGAKSGVKMYFQKIIVTTYLKFMKTVSKIYNRVIYSTLQEH